MSTAIDIFTGEIIKLQHNREHKGKSLIEFPDEFCVIDIETTGLSTVYDEIIEVAAVKYKNRNLVDTFTTLVKPLAFDHYKDEDGNYLDQFIVELTGITDEMLKDAPYTEGVMRNLKNFIKNDIIIGHNVNFDINFLYDNFEKHLDDSIKNNFVDTMRIARRIYPEMPHHRLSDLAEKFDCDYSGAHRALNDAEITAKCFFCMADDIIRTYGSFEELNAFIKAKSNQYKGIRAKDVESSKSDFDISHPLYNKVCVFTGTLEKMVRKEAMQIVADLGGINADNVTKKTNYLILGNNDYCTSIKDGKSSKQKKAEKLKLDGQDIEIIPENVFYDMIYCD